MRNILTQEQKDRLRCLLDSGLTCDKCSVINESNGMCVDLDKGILQLLDENEII